MRVHAKEPGADTTNPINSPASNPPASKRSAAARSRIAVVASCPAGRGCRETERKPRPCSEQALRYCLHANSHNYPAPPMEGFQLPGANLTRWEFEGRPDAAVHL